MCWYRIWFILGLEVTSHRPTRHDRRDETWVMSGDRRDEAWDMSHGSCWMWDIDTRTSCDTPHTTSYVLDMYVAPCVESYEKTQHFHCIPWNTLVTSHKLQMPWRRQLFLWNIFLKQAIQGFLWWAKKLNCPVIYRVVRCNTFCLFLISI